MAEPPCLYPPTAGATVSTWSCSPTHSDQRTLLFVCQPIGAMGVRRRVFRSPPRLRRAIAFLDAVKLAEKIRKLLHNPL